MEVVSFFKLRTNWSELQSFWISSSTRPSPKIKLTNEILELKENKKILIEESTEKQNLLEELNNSKDQNKLLTKVINKISDFENNNKILTDIIDDSNKN